MSQSLSQEIVLDDLDRKIIEFLQADGRTPYTTIATELNVAESTVRKRITRLIDLEVIKIVGIVDPVKVGLGTVAIVGVKVEGADLEIVVDRLSALPATRYIGVTTGNYDLTVEVAFESSEQLFNFVTHTLREIPGVVDSHTSLLMKVFKQRA